MDAKALSQRRRAQHKFNGEIRALVNPKLHPDMTEEKIWDIVSNYIDGGELPKGIKITIYNMRGKNVSGKEDEYTFAAAADTIHAEKKKSVSHQESKAKH